MNGCLTIDVGGTNTRFGLVSFNSKEDWGYKVIKRSSFLSPDDPIDFVKSFENEILSYSKFFTNDEGQNFSFALSVAGKIDEEKESLISLSTKPQWKNINLYKIIGEIYRQKNPDHFSEYPLGCDQWKMENDANALAVGCYHFAGGKGKDYNHDLQLKAEWRNEILVAITISTGIGSGIIANKQLHTGASGTAGEIGHMTIRGATEKCGCGRVGCFETKVGLQNFAKNSQKMMERLPIISSWFANLISKNGEITAKDIFDNVFYDNSPDKNAKACVEQWFDDMAEGLANIISLLDPSIIFIGGIGSIYKEKIIDPIKNRLNQMDLTFMGSAEIVPSPLTDVSIQAPFALLYY